MSSLAAGSCESTKTQDAGEKKPLKPCCACPETKKIRDAWWCQDRVKTRVFSDLPQDKGKFVKVTQKDVYYGIIIERGEESCKDLIEAHKDCMRSLGFKV